MKCMCGSQKKYEQCCGAFIDEKKTPATPEELMRSRYSAYAQQKIAYLTSTVVTHNTSENDAKAIAESTNSIEWLKLEILHTYENIVEFKAYYREGGSIGLLHEKSTFTQQNGRWLYESGKLFHSKIQRNEPCPCGSGKKYKKCCFV